MKFVQKMYSLSLFVWYIFKTVQQKKKKKTNPYYSVLSRTEKGHGIFFLLKFNALPQFLKVGRAIAPSSFAHEVVLV